MKRRCVIGLRSNDSVFNDDVHFVASPQTQGPSPAVLGSSLNFRMGDPKFHSPSPYQFRLGASAGIVLTRVCGRLIQPTAEDQQPNFERELRKRLLKLADNR